MLEKSDQTSHMVGKSNDIFDTRGRLIAETGEKVFSEGGQNYYRFWKENSNLSVNNYCSNRSNISQPSRDFEAPLKRLYTDIENSSSLSGVTRGLAVPFIIFSNEIRGVDLGGILEDELFPKLSDVFETAMPAHHFKSLAQGEIKLKREVRLLEGYGQNTLFNKLKAGKNLTGWIFPEVFREYAPSSQRQAFLRVRKLFPQSLGISLTGPIEFLGAMIGNPTLLTNPQHYPPIVTFPGMTHANNKHTFCIKSYGQHLEFWGLPKALMPDREQMSEQFTGGITVYRQL